MSNNSRSKGQKSSVKRRRKTVFEQIEPNAAGIDIGSREHYVAVPADRAAESVRHFDCYTPDLHDMAKWLKSCGVSTVAMESTGVYWIPPFQILEDYGIEVKLVDARHVRHVPGRKSDVMDCQWIQQLHSCGLLRGAFVPDRQMAPLRSYWRHRRGLVKAAARQIHLMQKAMDQMNIHLHKVLSDITGVTGMKIIRAIAGGERDPATLAQLRHGGVKSSEETIAKALTGHYRHEHLFALRQALEIYDVYQSKISDCDAEVEQYMARFETKADPDEIKNKPRKKNKRGRRKNEPYFDLRTELFRTTGADLTLIDAIDALTAQTIITECGFDMSRFPTVKHFASWLALCPNNRVTGGKVKHRGTRKSANIAAGALRVAAQSLHRSNSALGAYHRRMKARLGPEKAITATAHKLARLIYFMLTHGDDYVDKGQHHYEEQYKKRQMKYLAKRAQSMGYELVALQTGECVS